MTEAHFQFITDFFPSPALLKRQASDTDEVNMDIKIPDEVNMDIKIPDGNMDNDDHEDDDDNDDDNDEEGGN